MPRNNTRQSTPEDDRVREETAAALARGDDPFGDNEEIEKPSIEDQARAAQEKLDRANGKAEGDDADDADEAGEAGEGDDPPKEGDDAKDDKPAEGDDKAGTEQTEQTDATTQAEETTAAADDFGDDEDAPLEPRGWTGTPVADLNKRDGEIRAELAAKFKEYSDGVIEADEYTKAIEPLQAEQRKLDRTLARAEAAQDAVAEYERGVVNSVARQAAKEGVIYKPMLKESASEEEKAASAKATKQYDVAINTLLSDPDNARRSFRSIAKEAHAVVLALRGIKRAADTSAPAAKTAPTGKPPARDPAKPPVTLRQVPAAATTAAGGSTVAEQGKALKGAAYEAWFSKLSAKQKSELLDE